MPISTSKIAFKKKIPVVSLKRTQDKNHNQMRLVASADGVLLDVNDAFARELGVSVNDLQNRNLLDTILFQDFDNAVDDRALFNNLSSAQNRGPLSNLRAGIHTVLIGANQTAFAFQFDWISGHNGQHYLVASSVDEGEEPNWSDVIQKLNGNNSPAQPTIKRAVTPKNTSLKPKPAKQKITVETTNVTTDDMACFADINRNIQCVLSPDGYILRHNHIYSEKILIKGQVSFLDIVHDDDRATVRQYIQSLSMHDAEDGIGQDGIKFETRMKDQKGNPLWMFWRIHEKDDHLYCLGHDISGLKKTELSLKRREQELSEAQALANMGHWRWVVGSETLEWSDQIYKIFDVNPDDFIPTLDNANARLHKRDIGHMMQAFQRAIIEQNNYDIDFRVVRQNQSIGYVRCEGRCETDADGDVIALYGVMQDITPQTEHEMELRAAKDAAEQAYASKSRFLANMSHELRTPLNAIIGFSDMMNKQMLGPMGNDKYLEYSESIKHSGEHLLSLITDILDMSKIEAGKYELDLEKFQLGEVIKTAVRMIESRAQDGAITINNKILSNGPIIIADRRAVMQMLLNILSNAVKFTKEKGEISISIDAFENHVSIKIADNGIGIPANKLSAVLRPFEQVSTEFTRNHEGSGLGLAITKELAELHGGMISLESTVGEGTVVAVRLPKDASKFQSK